MIQIKDSSTVPFENNIYDTIILDPPYMSQEEFQKFIGKDKKNKVQNMVDSFLKTPKIVQIEKSVEQYAKSIPCWLVYFTNNRFNVKPTKYIFNWMREKGGMGGYIRRNTEYISCVNYFNLKPANSLEINAYDIDSSLQERYSLINSMGKKKQLTLREVAF